MNATRLRRHAFPDGIAMSREQRARRRAVLSTVDDQLLGQPMVLVNVDARDSDAAQEIALQETRGIVDILNFFADLVPNSPGWIYLAGEAGVENTRSLVVHQDGGLELPGTLAGPFAELSLKRLRSVPRLRLALHRIDELLRQKQRTGVADVLLTSVRWAGRASVEPVREHAFVMYVIALETLVLPNDAHGMKHRLQTRVAHLLADTVKEREWFYDRVKELYELRSDIIHEGAFEVDEVNLGRLRRIVKGCLLRVLAHRGVRQLSTRRELARWFDTR